LKILGDLEFDETWPTTCCLHLIERENKFPAKADQKFEFLLKVEFGLISQYFEIYTRFLNFTFGFRTALASN
jgi:hypothetical protein